MKKTFSRFAKRPLVLLCGAGGAALAVVGYLHFHNGAAPDPADLLPLVSAAATQPSAQGPHSGSGGAGAPSQGNGHARRTGSGALGSSSSAPGAPDPANDPANTPPAAPSTSFADASGIAPGPNLASGAPSLGDAGGSDDAFDSPGGAGAGAGAGGNTFGGSPHFDSPGGTAPGGSIPGSALAGNPPAGSRPADGTGTNSTDPISTGTAPSAGSGTPPTTGQVTAVPEPDSVTLLLAGLAMIGSIVVRRRNKY